MKSSKNAVGIMTGLLQGSTAHVKYGMLIKLAAAVVGSEA